MSEALLVMVHGTPRPESNANMLEVVAELAQRGVYPIVEVGYMECNEPTIPDAVQTCVDRGAIRIIAVPYFLHTGTHVADDLPSLLEQAQRRHPEVEFAMGRYIGSLSTITDILYDRARSVEAS